MLTVGQLLREARLKYNITLDTAEKRTKIRKKYLQAIEENQFEVLPGQTYATGFIRNYSDFLGIDSERTLALFRREQKDVPQLVVPKGIAQDVESPLLTFTPRIAALFISSALLAVFFFYLFFEYRFVALAPTISLRSPSEHQLVYSKQLRVQGTTDPDAKVTINGQAIELQVDGSFAIDMELNDGSNTITIQSENKFGKKSEVRRIVEYVHENQ